MTIVVLFTIADLNATPTESSADPYRNLANTAANFACGLWRDYAGATEGLPDPTGIGGFNNALYGNLCRPRGYTPPDPEPLFTGGQCPILYNVTTNYGSARGGEEGGTFPPTGTTTSIGVLGPIRAGYVQTNPGGEGRQGVFGAAITPERPDGAVLVWSSSDPTNSSYEGAFVQVVSVVPTNPGEVDSCGDPRPQRDPTPPPNDRLTEDRNIDFGDYNLDVKLQFVPSRIPPGIPFKPQIDINIGPFTVSFNPDGVEIKFSPDINFGPINFPPINDTRDDKPTPIPPVDECPDVDFTPVLEGLDELKKCACEPKYDLVTTVFDGRNSFEYGSELEIDSVLVEVTEMSEAVRSQSGGDDAPDVYFAGWYSFGTGTGFGDRLPISYVLSSLKPLAAGTKGFSCTLVFGSLATISITRRKPRT